MSARRAQGWASAGWTGCDEAGESFRWGWQSEEGDDRRKFPDGSRNSLLYDGERKWAHDNETPVRWSTWA